MIAFFFWNGVFCLFVGIFDIMKCRLENFHVV